MTLKNSTEIKIRKGTLKRHKTTKMFIFIKKKAVSLPK